MPANPFKNPGLVGLMIVLMIAISGCATRTWNQPLYEHDIQQDYLFTNLAPRLNDPETLVILAFSGGGVRAASFSYGVLEKLRDLEISVNGEKRSLLDEVDVISSVSGGSFTAAYYGLFGRRIFSDFESRVLKRNIQQELRNILFNPVNLARLSSSDYNLSDLAAEWFNHNIFAGQTFSGMSRDELPFIIINASDLNNGMTFSFVQQQFDFLCSNLNDYPVANAVMASAALPFIFSTIPLRNHDINCREREYEWIDDILLDSHSYSRNLLVARSLKRYNNPSLIPVIQLVDGGVTDNLGVRGSIMNPVIHYGDVAGMKGGGDLMAGVRRVLVIVANAQVRRNYRWSQSGSEPSLLQRLTASLYASLSILNTETMAEAETDFMSWANKINMNRKGGQERVSVHFVKLTFDDIDLPQDWEYFNAIPTTLYLPEQDVDRLRNLAHTLLEESDTLKDFLDGMK